MEDFKANVIFIMGVSGCGKSTIGHMLSEALKIPYFDGDDYHPKKNIRKLKEVLLCQIMIALIVRS